LPRVYSVRFETALCDRHGRVERVLQRGQNFLTNWGMDTLASLSCHALIDTLNLSSATDTRKRALPGGNELTITYTSPTNITVVALQNFFEAADAGRTLSVSNGGQELKIVSYTDQTHVSCEAPQGEWIPGFTPPGPTVYTTGAVYYTNLSTLNTWFTMFATYDTSYLPNPVRCSTDNANSQFIHERVYLSGLVSGAPWTVWQLGWSDGNVSHNVFGMANLSSADYIPVGKRYRVKLQVYSKYTPVNLTGVAVDWGATIGSFTMDIRQEYMGVDIGYGANGEGDGTGSRSNLLEPHSIADAGSGNFKAAYRTAAYSFVSTYWQNQSGGTPPTTTGWTAMDDSTLGAYTAGQFKRTKNTRWGDSTGFTAATALAARAYYPAVTLRPQTGTITKPSGYWCDVTFKVFWTRDLPV
jgi:hypothetical protein